MTNKPTSGQIQGHFDALRATKSFADDTSINIAGGNYASGKTFEGIMNVSDPAWVGTTATFFVYLDEADQLVLDDTSGFPTLSTKIARVEIANGIVLDIIDERASINGLIDGYQVLFDDSNSLLVEGDTVQEALESLDAYVANVSSTVAQNISKYKDFDIFGGMKNGQVKIGHVDDSPVLEFTSRPTGVGRVRYSASVPEDYVDGTDIVIKIFWSPEDDNSGDINWRMRYRSLTSGSDDVDSIMVTDSFVQSTSGTANRLTNTGQSLTISSSDINSDDILIINIERVHGNDDTYNSTAQVHLVRMEYTGRGVQ